MHVKFFLKPLKTILQQMTDSAGEHLRNRLRAAVEPIYPTDAAVLAAAEGWMVTNAWSKMIAEGNNV